MEEKDIQIYRRAGELTPTSPWRHGDATTHAFRPVPATRIRGRSSQQLPPAQGRAVTDESTLEMRACLNCNQGLYVNFPGRPFAKEWTTIKHRCPRCGFYFIAVRHCDGSTRMRGLTVFEHIDQFFYGVGIDAF